MKEKANLNGTHGTYNITRRATTEYNEKANGKPTPGPEQETTPPVERKDGTAYPKGVEVRLSAGLKTKAPVSKPAKSKGK